MRYSPNHYAGGKARIEGQKGVILYGATPVQVVPLIERPVEFL